MEPKYQTSFIPKKPVTTSGTTQSGGGVGLLLLVSIIIFLVSLGLAGYVFLEKNILIKKITADQDTIEANKSGLVSDAATIENLVELNARTKVAKGLLSQHMAVSSIFSFLQQGTLRSVRFKNFAFTSAGKNNADQNRISVQMSGQAKDWETVASQADEFGKADWKNIINEPKISNLSLNSDGSVSFLLTFYVIPSFLIYGSNPNL